MAIYIGGKKVQESGGKYKPQGVKEPKGRYTKSTVNPTDKFEGAKDRARANQAYLDQSDRDFKKKIQELNRKRIIDDARTGTMDKSDFTGKDGSGIFGLGGNRTRQTYVNPETGKSFNINKAREGLTSAEYSDWIRKNLGGPKAGSTEREAFKKTFPVASGAGIEKLMNLAVPFPLKMLRGLAKTDAGTMVGDLGGRKFRNFLSKFGDGTDNKIAKINEDAQKSTGELVDEVEGNTGLNSFRNYLSNFPGQQPVSSFVEDPRIGLGEQQPVNSFVEDPRLDMNEVIEDKIDLAEVPEILYGLSKEELDLPQATKNYIDEYMQTYGRGSAPFERAKEIDDRERQEAEEPIDYRPNIPGIQSFFDIRGDQYNDTEDAQYVRDLIMNTLDREGDIYYDEKSSTLPYGFLVDKGVKRKALDEGKSYMDVIRDPSFYEDVFQDVDYRTGDIPAEAFSGARTALIPEAASIIPQTFNYNDGGYANMSTYQKLKMMADSYGD